MFLFSAPSGNCHTAAGYNTEILEKLLRAWRTSLGERDGRTFNPAVAITDTDLMERNALMRVFPDIWLLICKFHLRQSWRNHRNKLLRGRSPVHMSLKARMARLETELVATTNFNEAREMLAKEKAVLERMLVDYPMITSNGLEHLRYLGDGYWMKDESLWRSWSDYGHRYAAVLLHCNIEGVLTTTNHLESFNGILKRKYLRRWQRGNRCLRVDVLIKLLVTKILPAIFEQQTLEVQEEDRWRRILLTLPGGTALVGGLSSNAGRAVLPPIAYFVQDTARDQAAAELLQENQISVPAFDFRTQSFLFTCYSSYTTVYDPHPTLYNIAVSTDGSACCDCADFTQQGGACKHLRAALLWLDKRRSEDPRMPSVTLPCSEDEARKRTQTDLFSRLQDTGAVAPSLPTGVMRGIPAAVVDEAIREANEMLYEHVGEDGEGKEDSREDGEEEDDDSDLESVATDTGEDCEFIFTALDHTGSARRAIDEQTFARVLFDLACVAPKLGQLGRYLKDTHRTFSPADAEKAAQAKADINLLSEQLGHLLEMKGPPISEPHQTSATPERPQTPKPTFATSLSLSKGEVAKGSQSGGQSEVERMRLKRASLYPHSPEKDAKQHQSYGHD
ncbi:uncharacterized protein STEHIDRAFT_156664 [Stereum hirsutum FP-91666 SS1]|uniref:uncharacterized protein n=1 Tax=Stereum hirsutum (strain FP-91666) TaxID=721885 RepID=UPI000440CBD3|nr:uncharacterized protein STEHIDRAFT_156664 [Stereum hirsutum FP-91666 SS1]EIM87717.1 hypothetical protein STEHIDRAFT_156664 [Stereum hirsutum FP-91666 SS1]